MATANQITVNVVTVSVPIALTPDELRHVVARIGNEREDLDILERRCSTADERAAIRARIDACRSFLQQIRLG